MELCFRFTIFCWFMLTSVLHITGNEEATGFCWTEWVNLYRATEGKDLEIFTRISTLQHGICIRPLAIDYGRVDGKPIKAKLHCNFYGCSCRNGDQVPGVLCADYHVRFLCRCKHRSSGIDHVERTGKFICPNGGPEAIRCGRNSVIKVTAAYYGNIWMSPCGIGSIRSICKQDSSETLQDLRVLCNTRRECIIQPPTTKLAGRGCNGGLHVLHVEYGCEGERITSIRKQTFTQSIVPAEEMPAFLKGSKSHCFKQGTLFPNLNIANNAWVAVREVRRWVTPKRGETVVALAPGNYKGTVGEIYVDPTCKYKCIFLLINRAICLPVCPVHYGFTCPDGNVIRWEKKPDKFAKQCTCRQPVCIDTASKCKVGEMIYKRGERFPLGCEEECMCLGRNELKCVPLCPLPIGRCAPWLEPYIDMVPSKYPQCMCQVMKCKRKVLGLH